MPIALLKSEEDVMFFKKNVYVFVMFVIVFSFSSLLANSILGHELGNQKFATDRILVKLTENVIDQVSIDNEKQINIEAIDQLNEQYHIISVAKAYVEVNNKQLDEQLGISRWYIFKYDDSIDIEFFISQLKELPEIEEAIPD
jgi:DNA-directed RNA polymerase specialized sigma subunit